MKYSHSDHDAARAGAHTRQHPNAPEVARFIERERDEETDAGAAMDDGMQDVAQHRDVVVERSGSGAIGLPLFNLDVGRGVHRVDHGCTIAAR